MPLASSLRPLLSLAALMCATLLASLPAMAQVSFPPAPPVKLAVNPVTNKVYVLNESSNSVTVLDAARDTTTTIAVGPRPQFVAVNPATNRIYVNNAGNASLTILDGATDTNLTPTPLPIGSVGPISVNPVTNVVYIVRLTSPATDEVTYFNAAANAWYTIATQSYQPIAMAVNPATDTIYVAHYSTGDVRIISGTYNDRNDHPATVSRGVWSKPFAIVANPATNRVYGITEDARGPIFVLNGADNAMSFPPVAAGHAVGPKGLAVNSVSNRIYAAFRDEVIVIDGNTNAYTYIPVATGTGPVGIGVNHITNKIYVAANDGTLTVIDGATNAVTVKSIPPGANAIGVNPLTNEAYVLGAAPTLVPGEAGSEHAGPLATAITPLPDNASGPDVTLTMNAASSGPLPVRAVYYQLDSKEGAWTRAAGTGPFSAAFTGLAPGTHTLHAFAADGQDAPLANGPGSSPLVGNVASYTFTVRVPPVDPGVSLAASAASSTAGQSVTFTASVSGSNGTATGTVDFRDGGTSIAGCAAVALSGGSAACATSSLSVGSHSITARYSGDAAYNPATSAAVVHTVNPAKIAATVGLASSPNPSRPGASVAITATLSGGGGAPTGTVTFRDGGADIAGCVALAVAASTARCDTTGLALGSHAITAAYSGDATYDPATSSALTHVVQDPPPVPQATLSPATLAFGGQSMGTTSPSQAITVTNTGSGTLTIDGVTLSQAQFAQANDCGSLAPGASCTITVTFTPAPAAGELNSSVAVSGTLSVASNGSGSPNVANLSGSAEKSLVTHYYRSVLRRAPDSGGAAFWANEAARVAALPASANEAWFAMAASFFASAEYAAQQRSDDGFVGDLYATFFNRPADDAGLAFWRGELAAGMAREAVLVSFMFSAEFSGFTRSIFGDTTMRAEVDTVGDFYRGLLARLPDDGGFRHWLQQFRAAQCQGADAVRAQADAISRAFANGDEYMARNRSNAQYVADLYNAFLRRGGDRDGMRFWIAQLDSGARTREQLRGTFLASPEFGARVDAIVRQGCMQ